MSSQVNRRQALGTFLGAFVYASSGYRGDTVAQRNQNALEAMKNNKVYVVFKTNLGQEKIARGEGSKWYFSAVGSITIVGCKFYEVGTDKLVAQCTFDRPYALGNGDQLRAEFTDGYES